MTHAKQITISSLVVISALLSLGVPSTASAEPNLGPVVGWNQFDVDHEVRCAVPNGEERPAECGPALGQQQPSQGDIRDIDQRDRDHRRQDDDSRTDPR